MWDTRHPPRSVRALCVSELLGAAVPEACSPSLPSRADGSGRGRLVRAQVPLDFWGFGLRKAVASWKCISCTLPAGHQSFAQPSPPALRTRPLLGRSPGCVQGSAAGAPCVPSVPSRACLQGVGGERCSRSSSSTPAVRAPSPWERLQPQLRASLVWCWGLGLGTRASLRGSSAGSPGCFLRLAPCYSGGQFYKERRRTVHHSLYLVGLRIKFAIRDGPSPKLPCCPWLACGRRWCPGSPS